VVELKADDDAKYAKVINLNLGALVPRMAKPHSPDSIATVKELEARRWTGNGRLLHELILPGPHDRCVHAEGQEGASEVSFGVAPGSRQVMEMITKKGALADIIASGARVLESTCGSVSALARRPGPEQYLSGRATGTSRAAPVPRARGLPREPESAVAAALTGVITDPRELGMAYPRVKLPTEFWIDDSMILLPSDKPDTITVFRPEHWRSAEGRRHAGGDQGVVAIKVGDKITTDHIMPAGSRLKYRSNIPKYAEFVFEGWTPDSRRKHWRTGRRESIMSLSPVRATPGLEPRTRAICPMYLGSRR